MLIELDDSLGSGINTFDAMKADPYVHSIFSETDTTTHDRLKTYMAGGYKYNPYLLLENSTLTFVQYAGKENPTLEQDIEEAVVGLVSSIRARYISSDSGDF
jgi:hypothetical protein